MTTTENAGNGTGSTEKENALSALAKRRDDYEAGRARLSQISERIERQKQTVLSLDQDCKDLDKQWRKALRDNDGDITESVRKIQRTKSENEDAATEIESMIQEMEQHLSGACKEVSELRRLYVNALQGARITTEQENVNSLVEKIHAYPGTEDLLSAIKDSMAIAREQTFNRLWELHGSGWITAREEGQRELEEAVRSAQGCRLLDMLSTLTDVNQGHELASSELTEIKPIPLETSPLGTKFNGQPSGVHRINR